MRLSAEQERKAKQVLNILETGTAEGRYDDITILGDGPSDRAQITFGRSQTTEWGNLRTLIQRYYDAPDENISISGQLAKFLPEIGVRSLVTNEEFKRLLRLAAQTDPVMKRVQDQFFDDVYWLPSQRWCINWGFQTALAALVAYDSWIQSGGVLNVIRQRFPEVPPIRGGEERAWIHAYVLERQTWLATHFKKEVPKTIYRTRMLMREIFRGNWDLAMPIRTQGVVVS